MVPWNICSPTPEPTADKRQFCRAAWPVLGATKPRGTGHKPWITLNRLPRAQHLQYLTLAYTSLRQHKNHSKGKPSRQALNSDKTNSTFSLCFFSLLFFIDFLLFFYFCLSLLLLFFFFFHISYFTLTFDDSIVSFFFPFLIFVNLCWELPCLVLEAVNPHG